VLAHIHSWKWKKHQVRSPDNKKKLINYYYAYEPLNFWNNLKTFIKLEELNWIFFFYNLTLFRRIESLSLMPIGMPDCILVKHSIEEFFQQKSQLDISNAKSLKLTIFSFHEKFLFFTLTLSNELSLWSA
jgi:hypothetical protein